MLYCIEITREIEEFMVQHKKFDHEPTREEILAYVDTLDCGYDDNYGKINYYRVD
mgnify:FL=1